MNPQELPQPNQEQLDPSVVALTKAIAQAESKGNYNAPRGKDGEMGAYQFTPSFIQDNAPKYLGDQYDPNSLTPEQQDKLAYSVIKDWGTQGKPGYEYLGKLSPAEIASGWNAGDPHAYLEEGGHQGISQGGAGYDTGKYVENVQKAYEQFQPYQMGEGRTDSGMTKADESLLKPTAGLAGIGLLGGLIGLGGEGLGAIGTAPAGLQAATGAALGGGAMLGDLGGEGIISGLIGKAKGAITGGLKSMVAPLVAEQIFQQKGTQVPTNMEDSSLSSAILGQQMPQKTEASQLLTNLLSQTLQNTPTGRRLMQDPNIQEAIAANGRYGFAPEVIDGNLDFSSSLKKSSDVLNKLSNGMQTVLQDEESPLSQAVSEAQRGLRQYAPSNEWEEGDKIINDEATKYALNFGKVKGQDYKQFLGGQEDTPEARRTFADNATISHANLERMKHEMGPGAKFDASESNTKRSARRALYHGAKNTISKNTKHQEFYHTALKEEQRIINGQKIMKRLNGKKSPEHKSFAKGLLHAGGRTVALYIGDKIGGPIGAVLGDLVGRHIIGAVDKRKGKTIFETPAVKRAIAEIKKDHPEYYKLLVAELKKAGIQIEVAKELYSRMYKVHKEGFVKKSIKNKERERDSQTQKENNGWREVKEGEILKQGGTIRMDQKTGKNYVKYS